MLSPDTAIPLVFAHANGFPGRSYRSFLAPMAKDFDLHPVERLGHHPDFPVGHNWLALRDELLETLSTLSSPVVGVGHSMGGVLMAMAAEQAPARFHCVVMLDPPLMLGIDALAMKLAKRLGLMDRLTPAGRSLGRRSVWASRDEMRDYLMQRRLFRCFTEPALEDYLQAGADVQPDGQLRLRYDPDIEVEIFRHLPDHLNGLPSRLQVPVGVLAGQDSDLMTPRRRQRLRRHGVSVSEVSGGHMFPMEHPRAARLGLQQLLDRLMPGEVR
ncbi:alpha/beta hydrolase [Halomonas sp. 18H]|uniref:alpha/beta fold hydrolase n=1 Tax=Halomonas almeriensis TaxID=308163 RepID=UPI0022308205|nr:MULTISPECIES: alpha/beta hydrolase [Halomonas]MCW4149378.1 alpha/beta hydrolase [Halomonas sp. 18H]MDN3553676.1 alpha/beta hydrolase [Halomonas almeriensis]